MAGLIAMAPGVAGASQTDFLAGLRSQYLGWERRDLFVMALDDCHGAEVGRFFHGPRYFNTQATDRKLLGIVRADRTLGGLQLVDALMAAQPVYRGKITDDPSAEHYPNPHGTLTGESWIGPQSDADSILLAGYMACMIRYRGVGFSRSPQAYAKVLSDYYGVADEMGSSLVAPEADPVLSVVSDTPIMDVLMRIVRLDSGEPSPPRPMLAHDWSIGDRPEPYNPARHDGRWWLAQSPDARMAFLYGVVDAYVAMSPGTHPPEEPAFRAYPPFKPYPQAVTDAFSAGVFRPDALLLDVLVSPKMRALSPWRHRAEVGETYPERHGFLDGHFWIALPPEDQRHYLAAYLEAMERYRHVRPRYSPKAYGRRLNDWYGNRKYETTVADLLWRCTPIDEAHWLAKIGDVLEAMVATEAAPAVP